MYGSALAALTDPAGWRPHNLQVAAARDCLWTATTDAAWVQLTPTSGQGEPGEALIASDGVRKRGAGQPGRDHRDQRSPPGASSRGSAATTATTDTTIPASAGRGPRLDQIGIRIRLRLLRGQDRNRRDRRRRSPYLALLRRHPALLRPRRVRHHPFGFGATCANAGTASAGPEPAAVACSAPHPSTRAAAPSATAAWP